MMPKTFAFEPLRIRLPKPASRRGGRGLCRPEFEVNRDFSEMCSLISAPSISAKNFLPRRISSDSPGLIRKNDKTSHNKETTLVRKEKSAAAAPSRGAVLQEAALSATPLPTLSYSIMRQQLLERLLGKVIWAQLVLLQSRRNGGAHRLGHNVFAHRRGLSLSIGNL